MKAYQYDICEVYVCCKIKLFRELPMPMSMARPMPIANTATSFYHCKELGSDLKHFASFELGIKQIIYNYVFIT